jgi:hypothetical protein
MVELITSKSSGSPELLDMVTRFYQSVFTLSPEELSRNILSEAAKVFKADIATWFLVTEDRRYLRLVDVYNDQGEQTPRPEIEPYELKWDARQESEVKGLTAWVAISGKSLFVPSLKSLLTDHKQSHQGKWDRWLYPDGNQDPKSGFLCMYAVPLFLPVDTPNIQERILGVLKVERRTFRKEAFTDAERNAFDVIANIMGFAYIHSERQRSLTLVDIGHVLIRPIADVALALDVVAEGMTKDQEHEKYLAESACKKLRSLSAMLRVAKDAFNDPTGVVNSMNLQEILQPQIDAIALLTGCQVKVCLDDLYINGTRGMLAALFNVIINLVENAIRSSQQNKMRPPVVVNYEIQDHKLTLNIENEANRMIPASVLNESKAAQSGPNLFKGLPRAFQLVARNGWDLHYSYINNRNRFDLITSLTAWTEVIP